MNVQDSAVAGRYARALFAAARAAKAEDAVRQELRRFTQLLRTSPSLGAVLGHPLLPLSEKKKRAAAEAGQALSPLFDRFLSLILAKKRLHVLPYVAGIYEEALEAARGVVKVHVKSAAPLSPEQVKGLEQRMAKARGGAVAVEASVDENLLAGLVFRVGDRVWDESARGRLQALKKRLLETAAS